jgi:uncharacterized protein (TIGR02466 family)
MSIQQTFSSIVYRDKLEVDNRAITDYCYHLQETSKGVYASNEGGWQSELINDEAELLHPLLVEITNRLNQLHIELGFKDTLRQQIGECWININGPGDFNKPHVHPGAFFSGVYYVKAGEFAGALELMNPITAHQYTIPVGVTENVNGYNSGVSWVQPEVGGLVIFSPWLQHHVQPNRSNTDRISIAFNSYLTEK